MDLVTFMVLIRLDGHGIIRFLYLLSVGQQPLRIYDYPHLHLIYNGEIYNYKELVAKYEFKYNTG